MLRKHHLIRGWGPKPLCLLPSMKFSQKSLWYPGIHWEWALFSLPNLQKVPPAQVWDLQGWPDTPSDHLKCLELPWQCCFSCSVRFACLTHRLPQQSSVYIFLVPYSFQLLHMFAALPGNCWPWSQKAHTIIKRDNAFSTPLALSMRNAKAREWSTLNDFPPGSSSIHKHTQPHAMHTGDTARPGVGWLWGRAGQCDFTLWHSSCSEVNLTPSFISSAPLVHIMQFHMKSMSCSPHLTSANAGADTSRNTPHPFTTAENSKVGQESPALTVTNHYFLFSCPKSFSLLPNILCPLGTPPKPSHGCSHLWLQLCFFCCF